MKTLRLALAVTLAAFIIDGTVANAQTTYYSRASADWDATDTWSTVSCSGATAGAAQPGVNDTAIICAGHTVDVDTNTGDVIVNTLVIQDDTSTPGTLDLQPDGSLRINRALDMECALTEPGKMTFSGAGGTNPGELKVGGDLAFGGPIDVTGTKGGKISSFAEGDVANFCCTCLCKATSGPLEISATLEMDGKVLVDTAQTITISGYGPRAGSSGCWEVTHADGTLKFDTTNAVTIDAACGHFKMTAGTLDIDQSVTHWGGLYQSGGTIDVAQNEVFDIRGRYVDCQCN